MRGEDPNPFGYGKKLSVSSILGHLSYPTEGELLSCKKDYGNIHTNDLTKASKR